MAARTWVGGGTNRASNPNDWSPSGAPQPNDTLALPPDSVINVWGNDLAGDTLVVSNPRPLPGQPAQPGVDIELSHNATANVQVLGAFMDQTYIDVTGAATLNFSQSPYSVGHTIIGTPTEIWLNTHASLTGALNPVASVFALVGERGTTYTNSGTDTFQGDNATIAVNVLGVGTMKAFALPNAASHLTFEGAVSSGQTVQAQSTYWDYIGQWTLGTIEIASPGNFNGTAEILNHGVVQIDNLYGATNWNFTNNVLTVKDSGGAVLDQTKLVSNDPSQSAHGLAVSFTQDPGIMVITAGTGFHGTV